jgi:hypothetical protein
MIGVFWYSPTPHWRAPTRRGQPAFYVEGETPSEAAWSLVEQFIDGCLTQHVFRGLGPDEGLNGGFMIMDAALLEASMGRVAEYSEKRFSPEWWERHRWIVTDFITRQVGTIDGFFDWVLPSQAMWSAEYLLDFYLDVIIRYSYAPHHGLLTEPVSPESALAYLEKHTYLRWVRADNMSQLLAGDLTPFM